MRRLIAVIFGALSCVYVPGAANVSAQIPATSSDPLELFGKLMPVFTHPRCANCHGAVDPHADSGPLANSHDGGIVPQGGSCAEGGCHTDDIHPQTRWKTALPSHNFNGRTAKQLCDMQSGVADTMNARTPDGYFHHLHTDYLIELAFMGESGGASSNAEPPPMGKDKFLQAARAWLDLGAKCGSWTGIITQTETFASNYSFGGPEPHTTTAVNESARRVVTINREFGKTRADIEMSGHQVMTMTVRDIGPAAPCTTTMTSYNDWSNAGSNSRGPRPASVRFDIAEDGTYVIHFTGGGDETTHTDERGTVVDGCASLLGPPDPYSIDLEWPLWHFNIRCPLPSTGPLALRRDLGESLDCEVYDAERYPRLKGRLTRVIVDHSMAFDQQSWLASGPIGISRSDTGEQLPVKVVPEWDFVLVD